MFNSSCKYTRTFVPVLLVLLILMVTPVFSAKPNEKKLRPDGIVIHSYNCQGPRGKKAKPLSIDPKSNYHFLVKKNGSIVKGYPETKILNHIGNGFNYRSLAVMVEGDFNNSDDLPDMPSMQKEALMRLLFNLMSRHNIPLSQIERHLDNDVEVACPGYYFPFFDLLYTMSKKKIRSAGNPLLEDICREKGVSFPLENPKIIVIKSQYKLKLFAGNGVFLKSYKIGLSNKPKGDKLKKGDRKTPTGSFYVCEKYPMRGWMEISYPGKKHAKIGKEKKVIGIFQYNLIVKAEKRGGVPFHKSMMGNDVGLHAGGFPYGRMRTDSTAGCIALEDPEAYEIYAAIPLGTEVVILEK